MARKSSQDVKHYLHTNVFHPNKERLLGFVMVSKTEPSSNPFKKRENCHYLCLYVTTAKPYKAAIARFVKAENDPDYERRRQWSLEELTKVDGKTTDPNSVNFELWFGTPFKFEAESPREKTKFIDEIAGACKKYLNKSPPEFANVKADVKELIAKTSAGKTQLEKTRQDLDERGEKLADLDQKTEDMARTAENFAETAHKLAEQYQ